MKLRASRQDLERELFGLKEKRIRLLDVINKLEDEEMALVSEVRADWEAGSKMQAQRLCLTETPAAAAAHQVNSVMHHKRALLKQVPFFEERARASAALGVVQDYLLASCQCLQHLHGGGTLQAAPGWSGTARVPRPAVCWAARCARLWLHVQPATCMLARSSRSISQLLTCACHLLLLRACWCRQNPSGCWSGKRQRE